MRSKAFPLLDSPAFTVGGRTYHWHDVLLAAVIRGDWDQFERDVRTGLACARLADETGQDLTDGELERQATEFRYDRDLLSAEEMEAWLGRVGLSVEDWTESLRRALLCSLGSGEAATQASDGQLASALYADGVCSGAFSRFAEMLAARAAVHASVMTPSRRRMAAAPTSPDVARWASSLRQLLDGHLAAADAAYGHFVELEAVYADAVAERVTDAARRALIEAHQLEWSRIRTVELHFASEPAANEAVLCCRVDGYSLEEVASAARTPAVERVQLLDDTDEWLRPALVSAARGDVLGPFPVGDEFVVVSVEERCLPTPADPDALGRAGDAAIAAFVDSAMRQHVTWNERI